ncbi:MAG: metal-dependent hydrolase, partial [Gammaproteobacteria bacterium]|nr:metal-dependent hydrolase [Gammaproteobacteria bacterium]
MDIVHHMFVGCAGFVISTGTGHEVAGAAFVAGSVLPDLDVAFMAFGKRFYLQNHQGITHSLFAAPLYAAIIICLPLLWLLDLSWQWPVFFAALSGLCIHICLDLFNTFRIQLFAPFIKQRYSFDAVFFIDSVAIFITALFYFLHTYLDLDISMLWYPIAFVIYFFAKWRLRIKVQSELACDFAIHSALHPFEFYILTLRNGTLTGCIFNA